LSTRITNSADVHPDAVVGDGTTVWHLAQVREGATLGRNCVVGRGAYVGVDVHIGDNVKIQNYALLYEPALVEEGVFIGPAVVLTNDAYPRAVSPDGAVKCASDWEPVGVTIKAGASLGAHSVCIAPVTIGRWAMVAAASVVTRDVPDHALMVGAPARRVGWVGRAGVPLKAATEGCWLCPLTGDRYTETDERLALASGAMNSFA
jgi:UDP-2-acetamido-3-amino-2,3-dideoxy-glucuronate N-acetyltransferase